MASFAMPLQVTITSDRLVVWVMGGDGQILFGLPHPGPDGLARLKQIVEMANRADKALEACRAVLQVHGLNQRIAEAIREGPDWSDEYSAAAERAWHRATQLAREALEMEERDRRG